MMADSPQKTDYLWDAISLGLFAVLEALTPTIVWYAFVKKQPRMRNYRKSENDWYLITWWTWWIGNLLAFGPAMLFWIPSYFSKPASIFYGLTWVWAFFIAMPVGIFVWTGFFVSGIEWGKTWKEIWATFILYTVGEILVSESALNSVKGAQTWYMWHYMDKNCDKD